MTTPLFQVDAFTDQPFTGNPAAVCLLEEPREDAWMRAVASEMNLPETAFVLPAGDDLGLRWFTPTMEVDLCGHATLAAAHVLWEEGILEREATARFKTRSGDLSATREGNVISLNFPSDPPRPCDILPGLSDALGATLLNIEKATTYYVAEVEAEAVLLGLQPDPRALAEILPTAVAVTCGTASADFDFLSRFFAPAMGIDEDPVTGSAHCCLGPYWASRLNKTEFVARQVSRRGGTVNVRCRGERVLLGGQAVTVFRGNMAS